VAKLPPPEADALLDLAEAENWSTRQLRVEVTRLSPVQAHRATPTLS
jgi:hypothetical protein